MRLISVTEDNWMEVASLSVKEEQKIFVAPAIGIFSRGYDKLGYKKRPRTPSVKASRKTRDSGLTRMQR